MTKPNQDREARIDEILAKEQAARDAESRSAIHAKLIEEDRVAREAEEYAALSARRAVARENALAEREKAMIRYAAAVKEFRLSYAELAALDQMLGMPGFGNVPHTAELKHAHASPDAADGSLNPLIAGSLQSDVIKIIHSRRIEA